jgi:hypothetical protein
MAAGQEGCPVYQGFLNGDSEVTEQQSLPTIRVDQAVFHHDQF